MEAELRFLLRRENTRNIVMAEILKNQRQEDQSSSRTAISIKGRDKNGFDGPLVIV
jgi:hypothetical protein